MLFLQAAGNLFFLYLPMANAILKRGDTKEGARR